jgi:hypothetical protein
MEEEEWLSVFYPRSLIGTSWHRPYCTGEADLCRTMKKKKFGNEKTEAQNIP